MENNLEKLGYKKVDIREVRENSVTLFDNIWALVTAGDSKKHNTMTISWGTLGELWNKDVVNVYVSSSRYTKSFMDNNDYFTVEFFPQEYKKALGYLGSHSGKDEDKIKKVNFTPIYPSDNTTAFAEGCLIIVAKKIYSHEFEVNKLDNDTKAFYNERQIGLHTMYIGEIVEVWTKE